MKTAAWSLLSLVLFGIVPLCAQQPPEGLQRALYIGGGEEVGGTAINGLAVGWSLRRDHTNVTIAAHLKNGGGIGSYAAGTAYLTRKIGPLSSTIDEVAKKEFELPDNYNGMFALFTNLILAAGEYWLVFEDPHNERVSYATWVVSIPPFVVHGSRGTRYLGTSSYAYPGPNANYMPASFFRQNEGLYGYRLEVTGEPVPLLHDEDPSRVTLR